MVLAKISEKLYYEQGVQHIIKNLATGDSLSGSLAKCSGSNSTEEISNFVVVYFLTWVVETNKLFRCMRPHRFRYLNLMKIITEVTRAWRNWRHRPYRVLKSNAP